MKKYDDLKLKAIEIAQNNPSADVVDIYDMLCEEDGFEGTLNTVRYWLKHREDIKQKVQNRSQITQEDLDRVIEEIEDDEDDLEFDSETEAIGDDPINMTREELIAQYLKMQRSRQLARDQNRILRKVFRESDRVVNTTEELLKEILNQVRSRKPLEFKPTAINVDNNRRVGIIQLNDLHLNECIRAEDTKGANTYDFEQASRRLMKYANRAKLYLPQMGINDVVIAFVGDMFNSNRRKDEVLRNQRSLAEAFIVGSELIASFVQDLATTFNVECVSVYGNESRLDEHIQSVEFHNNFDYLLPHFLDRMLEDQPNVLIHDLSMAHEDLVEINGANILLSHNHNKTSIDKKILKYTRIGKIVHYVLTGHIHSLSLTERSSQGASVVGTNAYAFYSLDLFSRAMQVMHIVENEEDWPAITPIPVDLQNADAFKGYPLPKDVNRLSMRTGVKKGGGETILRIVI